MNCLSKTLHCGGMMVSVLHQTNHHLIQGKERGQMAEEFFSYKGKPLVRKGDTIYYGDMSDAYVVMLNIHNTQKAFDMDMAGDVAIQLMATDPNLNPLESIIKRGEKKGLYPALELADIWLERALKDNDKA